MNEQLHIVWKELCNISLPCEVRSYDTTILLTLFALTFVLDGWADEKGWKFKMSMGQNGLLAVVVYIRLVTRLNC